MESKIQKRAKKYSSAKNILDSLIRSEEPKLTPDSIELTVILDCDMLDAHSSQRAVRASVSYIEPIELSFTRCGYRWHPVGTSAQTNDSNVSSQLLANLLRQQHNEIIP